ncbi:Ig-like domain-containing alpha-2-macroglobulin family protein [Chloroflexus sp.]|uniref:Ig-like domain-containing alpha-2-macroglobulin family protein n=1 Tax=Chloroflexus sp. TaxID=1904827 RepID=UPI0026152A78|nr:Ig-like domain-containing alpha-2-macroglobulin family protein [uncultured Chloroflexus sp.]
MAHPVRLDSMIRGIRRWMRLLAHLWTIVLAGVVVILLAGLAIRWLAPLSPWTETPTVQVRDPLPQSRAVPPRSAITLAFSLPMNPFTVARALRIDPPVSGTFEWSDDMRVLRIIPAQPLQPDTTYRIRLLASAQSRWWRSLAQPLDVVFVTAAQPTVTAALAPRQRNAPLALIFSQPMVDETAVGQPVTLTFLRITPPLPVSGQWLDPQTLLIEPTGAFAAATTYTLTLDPSLRDARGIELGQPFQWQFTTPWPTLLERKPLPDERWVNPQQPLTLTFDAPIDQRLLSAALVITPTISSDLSSSTHDGRYTVTLTPHNGWTSGQTYYVRLQPPDAIAPLAEWRFAVEPEPTLIASFPGQNQTLAPGQEIRLIFSTPMDEAGLRAGLRFDPPVADVTIEVEENRVSLRPVVQAATTYTLTIAIGTRDQSGVPLAEEVTLTFRTASAPPQLRIAGETLLSFPVESQPAITIERMNVAFIDAQLYQLDLTTLARALLIQPGEWINFVPERYGQPLIRSWRELINDPPDTTVRSLLPLMANSAGDPLTPGAYYLRLTTSNGLRADRLLLISSLHLTMLPNGSELLIWVTKRGDGAPVSNIPLSLYGAETLLARGSSNDQGLWRIPWQLITGVETNNSANRAIIALAEGDGIALARVEPATLFPTAIQALLAVDRLSYRPGGVVRINGLVRERQPDGRLDIPAVRSCQLQLDGASQIGEPTAVACAITDKGWLNGSLRLDARLPPGQYTARVTIGDATYQLPLRVSTPSAGTNVRVNPTRPAGLTVNVTRAELPVSGATVSWNLLLETLSVSELDGVSGETIGPASETQASAVTDLSGRVTINLPAEENLLRPLRYRARITVQTPDGEQILRNDEGIIIPRNIRLEVDAPIVIDRNERAAITVSVHDPDGQPLGNTLVEIELRRSATEPPLIVRRARTAANGRMTTALVPLASGRYELIARVGSVLTKRVLWVAGSPIATSEPSIVADRSVYSIGDTARLLITGPAGGGSLLLIIGQGTDARTVITTAQPGKLIDLSISAEFAPLTPITALIDDGSRVWWATTMLLIDPLPSPTINLSLREALPNATVTFTVTAATDTLLVTLNPTNTPPNNLEPWNRLLSPAHLTTAQRSGLTGIILPATIQSVNDQHEVSVRLPSQPGRWRIEVIAVYASGFATIASVLIDTNQPVEAVAVPLPALRQTDTVTTTLLLRNVDRQPRSIRARLWLSGGVLLDPSEQSVTIPPGSTLPVFWQLQPQPGVSIIGLRYEVIDSVPLPPIEYAVPVINEGAVSTAGQTRVIADATDLTLPDSEHEVVIAAGARAALTDQAQRLAQTITPTAETLAAAIMIGRQLERTATTTSETEYWQTTIAGILQQLRALRNGDGGWGWWPTSRSDPFVTAFVLEAVGQLDRTLPGLRELSEPALRYLRRERSNQPPDAQAYIDYVMFLHSITVNQTPTLTDVGPAGLAFTALRLANERSAMLNSLWATAGNNLAWAGATGLPPSTLAVSASVVQALSADRPADPRLDTWRTALLRRWQVDGWPTPYEAARVALALGAELLSDGATVTVSHDLTGQSTISGTERLRIGGGSLRIEPENGIALVAIRSPTVSAGRTGDVRARLRYVTAADPLVMNQVVQIDVLLVISQPLFRLDVTIPLPTGITPVKIEADHDFAFQRIDRDRRQAQIGGARLAAGVYRFTVTAQATTAGVFQAPPVLINAPGSDLASTIIVWQNEITITPITNRP